MSRATLFLAVLIGSTVPAWAQTANEILDDLAETYLARIEAIEDYTVVSDAFTSRHKKFFQASGAPYFKTITEGPIGGGVIGNMTTTFGTDDLREFRERMTDRAELAGSEPLRDVQASVLRLTDFAGLPAGSGQPPDSVLFFIDPDAQTLMRIEMYGTDAGDGAVIPTIDFEDYRDVEGMRIPFISRVTMVGAQMSVSQAQVDQAREAIERMEERLAAMPAAQREAMLAAIQPQIDRMQAMVNSGTMETVYAVTDVQVNTGLDAALFND